MSYPWLAAAEARFAQQANSGRLAHAVLLSGPRGLGKRELALREAATLLCLEGARPGCGRCRSCELMASGAHPDFRLVTFELNDKGQLRKEIVVDQIRELIASLQLTHSLSARKVAVIHPAESLNRNAANALLKTLEEPAGDAVLLLVSNNDAGLPATVRSRCQHIFLRLPETADAVFWLVAEHRIDADTAQVALEAGAGSPLQAGELLRSGGVDSYRSVSALLERMEADARVVGDAFAALSGLEPVDCWNWLSIASAGRLRQLWVGAAGGVPCLAAAIARLQSQANRNRRLVATPVRHDLLLRDWLLQWAALAGP
jgi:DNA polymerase-3 subunit delta'